MKNGFTYLLVVIVVLLSVPGFEYSYPTDPAYGRPIKWRSSDMPVDFRIDDTGTPDCANEFAAIQSAYQVWEDASAMNWNYGGTGNYAPGDWGLPGGTNINVWCESNWATITGEALSVVAICVYWYSYDISETWLTDADIIYNGENYTWSDSGAVGEMDVQNAAAHETGHSLVLSDLYGGGNTEKTMYGLIDPGETKKRTLESDDIAGARFLYPTPIPTPTPELTPTDYPPGWTAAHGWTIYE